MNFDNNVLDALKVPNKKKFDKTINLDLGIQVENQNTLPTPSLEQLKILNSKSDCIRVHALAGTGKSTTVLHMIKNNPNDKTLYIVFNALLKSEMIERLKQQGITNNVDVLTMHGYAYSWMSNNFFNGVNFNVCFNRNDFIKGLNIVENDVSSFLSFKKKYKLKTPFDHLSSWNSIESYLNNVYMTLNNFFKSTDGYIKDTHIERPEIKDIKTKEIVNKNIAEDASILWIEMVKNPFNFYWDFDGMIRLMSLDDDPWPYNRIILDEAQDSSYHFAEKMYNQKHAKRIYLGDPHQSIYHFRSAFDATKPKYGDELLTLTETHRFGQEIARLANQLLSIKGTKDRLIGLGKKSSLDIIDKKDVPDISKTTFIGATNMSLIDIALNCISERIPYKITGDKKLTIQQALDLIELQNGNLNLIKTPLLKKFDNYLEFENYIFETGNPDYEIPMEWIKNQNFKNILPTLQNNLLSNYEKDISKLNLGSSTILSTAHQMKGFTVDGDVFICSDFNIPSYDEYQKAVSSRDYRKIEQYDAKINIAYVAVTRCSQKLLLSTKFKEKLVVALQSNIKSKTSVNSILSKVF